MSVSKRSGPFTEAQPLHSNLTSNISETEEVFGEIRTLNSTIYERLTKMAQASGKRELLKIVMSSI